MPSIKERNVPHMRRLTFLSIPVAILALWAAPGPGPTSAAGGAADPSALPEVAHLLTAGADSRADSLAQRLAEDAEARFGRGSEPCLGLLDSLVSIFEAKGRFRSAQRHSRSVVEQFEALPPRNPGRLAQVYGRHARLCRLVEDLASCVTYSTRAIEIGEKLPGFDREVLASYLEDLGFALRDQTRRNEALAVFERALALRRAAHGDSTLAVAQTLRDIASVRWRLGRLADARRALDTALVISEHQAQPDTAALLDLYNFDAILLAEVARHDAALGRFLECLALSRASTRSTPFATARYMNNVGLALSRLRRHREAWTYHDSARVMRERIGDATGVIESEQNLGFAALGLGDLAEAEARFRRVIEERRKRPPSGSSIAVPLANLGAVRMRRGRYAEAESCYAEAIAIRERMTPDIHPAYATALTRWAESRACMGDTAGAMTRALRSDSLVREHLVLATGGLAERQLLDLAALGSPGQDLAVSLAVARSVPDDLERVFDAVIRNRALVLDEMAQRRREMSAPGDPLLVALQDSLATIRKEVVTELGRGAEGIFDQRRVRLEALHVGRERIEGELAARSARFRSDLSRRRVGWADVRAALAPRAALVAYIRYREYLGGGDSTVRGETGAAVPADAYGALVIVDGRSGPSLHRLGAATQIDSLVQAWSEMVSVPSGRVLDRVGREATTLRTGRALRAVIWDPLADILTGLEQVFVVPTGALWLVNLGALPAPTESRYLVETGPPMHVLSAERDLVSDSRDRPASGLLVLAAPDFGTIAREAPAPSGCQDLSRLRFSPLPATRREAEEVSAIWDSAAGGPSRGSTGTLSVRLTGALATEESFRRLAPGRRVIHLATHGYFLSECRDSTTSARILTQNPLLRSGLGLAGANRRGAPGSGGDDGLLTAEEVAGLALDGVEWVVLSACETGLGDLHASEGILGLRRAFAVGGARTTIMSLWRVEDRTASRWMRLLYHARFVEGLSTAEACRRASLEMLRLARAAGASTHPWSWAAFVAAGAWR